MILKEKIDRKTQIRQVASRLFKERGYLATSMRDLADALGIEAASLYSHFKGKDDLLWDIASRSADEFFSDIQPLFQSNLVSEIKLREMISAHIQVIARNIDASAVFFYEWKHLSSEKKAQYGLIRDQYEDLFRGVIIQGIEQNLFKPYDERLTARAILSALNWTHTWYRPDGDLRPDQIGEQLAGILINGLIRTK